MPLADLGRRAWPRDPAQVSQEDFVPIAVHGLMVELGWWMVDFVAVQVQGITAFQASVPLLDPMAGGESPTFSTGASGCAWRTCPPPKNPLCC